MGAFACIAAWVGLWDVETKTPPTIAPIARQADAVIYRDRLKYALAFLKNKRVVPRPKSQITNVDANGAATRMQGYAARLGLGTTRTRNQTRDPIPRIGKSIFK
jgi:hypothetical protein